MQVMSQMVKSSAIPLGTATFASTAPVTPEQSAPTIAVTPSLTKPSAAVLRLLESIHVESALNYRNG